MGDIDRFSKEWTEMFNDLSTGSDRREDEVPRLDASPMRIHPPVRPGGTSALDPAYSAIGKQTQDRLVPASLEFAAVSRSRAWTLSSADGEMIQFDVTPASLARWQHRDNAMIKDTPAEEKLVRNPPFWMLSNLTLMLETRRTRGRLHFRIRSALGRRTPALTERSHSKPASLNDSPGATISLASPRGERLTAVTVAA